MPRRERISGQAGGDDLNRRTYVFALPCAAVLGFLLAGAVTGLGAAAETVPIPTTLPIPSTTIPPLPTDELPPLPPPPPLPGDPLPPGTTEPPSTDPSALPPEPSPPRSERPPPDRPEQGNASTHASAGKPTGDDDASTPARGGTSSRPGPPESAPTAAADADSGTSALRSRSAHAAPARVDVPDAKSTPAPFGVSLQRAPVPDASSDSFLSDLVHQGRRILPGTPLWIVVALAVVLASLLVAAFAFVPPRLVPWSPLASALDSWRGIRRRS